MPEFTTGVTPEGGCTLTVSGEVDIACVEEFLAAARDCVDSAATDVEIDLGGVSFIDSSGLGTLVRIRNQIRERGGKVRLTHVPEVVARVLEVSGLAQAFEAEA
ncbi:STAS domain-containing protein [Nocardioides marmorisolisilvae]|uniref:Anti-sigma factor antagonist n=1 Tax=Nocardioides marmorisolisilvae TaxID=1542737 RepID=A0A3N0DUA7_9ACTN|nr:STAS domain-containing protein [Nocardioides marmorisolisilvae]RNL78983.1 anti-sigma factor antagonist [Nocardioides marmorisolisilvae]